jgi:glycosyltransferase involved in cell wall biosynthesis
MTTMLIISRYCGFDTARYAGSQIHNYYLKRLYRDFEVKLVTVASPTDAESLDFTKYGIDADVIFIDERPQRWLFFLLFNWRNIFNYFGKTLGLTNGYVQRCVLKQLKALQSQGYRPDCILLEWTQIVIMVGYVKKLFPDANYIGLEHDVSFLKYQRFYAAARRMNAIKERLRFHSVKKIEINSLRQVDLIVTLNEKDKSLLIDQGLRPEFIHPIAPYYTDYGDVRYNPRGKAIFFFGAMDRPENYLSIAWFVERVFQPHLAAEFSLTIVGARPHPSLEKYRSERIVITGFVQDIRPYLEGSVCMVAPLLSGAGIKVKVIEVMSAGVPVIANEVAIEGIAAVDGKHYLHAETPEEYLRVFDSIRAGSIDLRALSNNAKKLIARSFNLEESYLSYQQAITRLCENL